MQQEEDGSIKKRETEAKFMKLVPLGFLQNKLSQKLKKNTLIR